METTAIVGGHHLPAIGSAELSSIVGWISIWVWLIPSISQLQENYVLKSGEGLSIVFVCIWLAGDALNMIGAYIEGLLPTMIILAGYYCLCDLALIWQYYYYRKHHDYFHPSAAAASATVSAVPASNAASATETTPLLASPPREKPRQPTLSEEISKCVAGLALTTLAGLVSWYITFALESRSGSHDEPHKKHLLNMLGHHKDGQLPVGWRWDAQVAGWASAVLYLSSRIPQIIKNRQTKCEGLSLALFVFAVMGNLTYVASIVIKSRDRDYIVENLSWLVGSSGTVFLDFVVLAQFIGYRQEREHLVREREAAERAAVSPSAAA